MPTCSNAYPREDKGPETQVGDSSLGLIDPAEQGWRQQIKLFKSRIKEAIHRNLADDPPGNVDADGSSNSACSSTHPQDDGDLGTRYDESEEEKREEFKNRSGGLVYSPKHCSGRTPSIP